ncbi:guanylate kinase [[Clostridium] polysaccharolyticum]|uniref:Guanylate kinase n=1 Tax=[Clostridium] polysaccharolyticum TaxID=29364 RepID=A0A1H9Y021_9FIRM|nr:guanylate kinase [[Clostridium] polysaccharolyticum]SES62089.1 guanylate kinase [[Clostridium] polysaccharolyticum]
MSRRGILTVVSGFSGAGKGTVMKELVKKPDYKLSISATTRLPREGEIDGREYFFLTREKFESMIETGQFIEHAEYVGNYYGTPKQYVEEQLEAGYNVILEIEIQGALHVKEVFPDALLLFIVPPSAKTLKERLINRGTEDEAAVQKRMNRAVEESQFMEKYDYLVVNDKLNECVEAVHHIILSQRDKVKYNTGFICEMQRQLKAVQEGDL